jgi:hypothetical protein
MGHVNAVVEFEAADDDAAITEARKYFPEQQRELWHLDRSLKRLQPE